MFNVVFIIRQIEGKIDNIFPFERLKNQFESIYFHFSFHFQRKKAFNALFSAHKFARMFYECLNFKSIFEYKIIFWPKLTSNKENKHILKLKKNFIKIFQIFSSTCQYFYYY